MPTYEYRCENDHVFEVMQRIAEDALSECTTCGAPVQRVFHPVAVHFKGSGFYSTDYGKGGASKPSENGGSESKSSSSEGSDSSDSSDSGSSGSSEKKSSDGDGSSSGSKDKSSDSGESKSDSKSSAGSAS